MSKLRLTYDLFLLLFLVLGTAPFVILLGIVGVFRFRNYGEFLVAGALFELLYGTGGWSLPLPFPMFICSAIIVVIIELIRVRLR